MFLIYNAAKCALDVNYRKVTSLNIRQILNVLFFSARGNNEHRRKSHSMCLNYFQTIFTLHPGTVQLTVHVRRKSYIKPCKIMTDNQNMNKTSMKDVQQQHFYRTALPWIRHCSTFTFVEISLRSFPQAKPNRQVQKSDRINSDRQSGSDRL